MKRRIKNTSSGRRCWLVLTLLWLGHAVSVAQQNIYLNGQTNYLQAQTNNFQFQPVGPSTPGSGAFGGPFMGTSGLAFASTTQDRYLPTGPPVVEWGPFGIYPHLLYRMTYGNGIEAQPGVNSTTFVNTVSPGVFVRMGSLWFVDYTPSVAFYSNPIFHDTTDQKVVLNGTTTNGAWMLSLAQSYVATTQPVVETGTQLEQQAYATAINADWQMGSKTSLQLGVNQNFRFTQELVNLHEWSSADWFNYQFQPQLGAALGVTGGYDEISLGSSNPFEQALGRVIFQPGAKLRLIVIGGVEDRRFVHPAAPSVLTPIFQAMATYQVNEGTLLTLLGNRLVTPGLFENDLNIITTVSANLRQKIIGNMFFDVSGGYTDQSYTSIVAGPLPPHYFGTPPRTPLAVIRSDTRTFGQIRLSTVFHTRLKGSIFYMFTDNSSSQSKFKYSGNQGGLELDYQY